MKKLIPFLLLTTSSLAFASEPHINTKEAPLYVGKRVVACGNIAQVVKRNSVNYLNFDNGYPTQTLSAVIWEDMLEKIENQHGKLELLRGNKFCMRGIVSEYKNTLQIKISNPTYLVAQ